MRKLPFSIANDWDKHPDLHKTINWKTASGAGYVIYEATVGKQTWVIRLNDFPDEPLHTLLIGEDEIMHFDDWPSFWPKQPLPKTHA